MKQINTNQMLKKLADLFEWVVVSVLLLTAVALVLSNFDNPLKLRVFSVNSGSMEPAVHLGSLVFVRPAAQYFEGDVITFADRNDPKSTTTHRILSVSRDEDLNKTTFETKGDANEDKDVSSITDNRVLGKVIFILPLLGYIVAFAKTQLGFTFLIVIPATLLIFNELKNIKDEVVGAIAERKLARSNVVLNVTEVTEEIFVSVSEPNEPVTHSKVKRTAKPKAKSVAKKVTKVKNAN